MCICLLVVTGYEILACYVLPVWRVDATYNSNSPAVPGTRGRAARIVPDPRGRPAPPLHHQLLSLWSILDSFLAATGKCTYRGMLFIPSKYKKEGTF